MVLLDMNLAMGAVVGLGLVGSWLAANGESAPYVDGLASNDRMPLVAPDTLTPVYAEAGDHEVVRVAAADLVTDIERVTGNKRPLVIDSRIDQEARRRPLPKAVIIGSLDRSEVIRGMVKNGKLELGGITGRWESFALQVVTDPVPGVSEALVIAGSDRHGIRHL